MSSNTSRSHLRLGTFHAACWTLALVAFVEVVAVGVALALRHQPDAEPVVVERVVTEYVPLTMPAPAPPQPAADAATPKPQPHPQPAAAREEIAAALKAFTSEEELMKLPISPASATPTLSAPFIADPVVERLLAEAREARVRDDLRAAFTKLEEAQQKAPDEPHLLYQFGEIHESAGNYDKAADFYESVLALGPMEAGSLYELAGHKLSHGFEHARSMEGALTLGRVRHFDDKRVEKGEKIILTIPVLAAPGRKIDDALLVLTVIFFDKVGGEVRQTTDTRSTEQKWLTRPLDWIDTGEELLQITYYIPPADERDRHLLGERTYFGQIVELRYDGELLDHQAWPRTLALQRNVPEANPLFLPDDIPMDNWNEGNPLLPPLPEP